MLIRYGGRKIDNPVDYERASNETMDVHIRRAVLKDAEVIARVLYDSFVEYRHLYTDEGFAATALRPEQIRIRIREGPLWLASRSKVEGTVSAVAKGDSLYIRGMAVLPSARGSGLGSRLLHQVERWADGRGIKRLFLSTTPFLSSAIHLYERFGFQRTTEGPGDLFGTPLFSMEKINGPFPTRTSDR